MDDRRDFDDPCAKTIPDPPDLARGPIPDWPSFARSHWSMGDLKELDDEAPVELPRPSRRLRWAWAGSLLVLVGLIGAGLWLALRDTPVFTLDEVALSGTGRLTADEALALAGLERGASLLEVDEAAAAARLQSLPFVRSARVRRALPRTVRIEITEREPALLVALGSLYVADAQGVLYRRLYPGEKSALPVLSGLTREDVRARPAFVSARAREAIDLAKAAAGHCIEEITFHEVRGFGLVLCDGPVVRVGHPPFTAKLAKLAPALRKAPGAALIHLDDERRPDRVVVRMARKGD